MKKLFVATMLATLLVSSTAFAFEVAMGTVRSVDPAGKSLTLVGGTTFTIPRNISIEPIKPGQVVTIAYQDTKDGQKEMTAIWIDGVRS